MKKVYNTQYLFLSVLLVTVMSLCVLLVSQNTAQAGCNAPATDPSVNSYHTNYDLLSCEQKWAIVFYRKTGNVFAKEGMSLSYQLNAADLEHTEGIVANILATTEKILTAANVVQAGVDGIKYVNVTKLMAFDFETSEFMLNMFSMMNSYFGMLIDDDKTAEQLTNFIFGKVVDVLKEYVKKAANGGVALVPMKDMLGWGLAYLELILKTAELTHEIVGIYETTSLHQQMVTLSVAEYYLEAFYKLGSLQIPDYNVDNQERLNMQIDLQDKVAEYYGLTSSASLKDILDKIIEKEPVSTPYWLPFQGQPYNFEQAQSYIVHRQVMTQIAMERELGAKCPKPPTLDAKNGFPFLGSSGSGYEGYINVPYTFTITPDSESRHVEYLVEWEKGVTSGWNSANTITHVWPSPGEYFVQVRARNPEYPPKNNSWEESLECEDQRNNGLKTWSAPINVKMTKNFPETFKIEGPSISVGEVGKRYAFSVKGVDNSILHSGEKFVYIFKWGNDEQCRDSHCGNFIVTTQPTASNVWCNSLELCFDPPCPDKTYQYEMKVSVIPFKPDDTDTLTPEFYRRVGDIDSWAFLTVGNLKGKFRFEDEMVQKYIFAMKDLGGECTKEPPQEDVPNQCSQIFPDVGPQDWFCSSVQRLKDAGAIKGYDDGSYQPGKNVQQDEFLKIVLETIYGKEGVGINFPTTANPQEWSQPYVDFAKNTLGIIGNDFIPEASVKRGQAVKMLVDACAKLYDESVVNKIETNYPVKIESIVGTTPLVKKVDPTKLGFSYSIVSKMSEHSDQFPDVAWGTNYYLQVYVGKIAKILQGRPNGTFGPEDILNRAESATITCRIKFGETQCGGLK